MEFERAMIVAVASEMEPERAMIVAEPSATEVTRPVGETVATVVAVVTHVTVAPGIAVPPASFTVAVSVAVSARDAKASELGDNSTMDSAWTTVTDALAVSDPLVAVIVAVPSATEVTRPVDDTVATAASDIVHVTVAPLIVSPFASVMVAVS